MSPIRLQIKAKCRRKWSTDYKVFSMSPTKAITDTIAFFGGSAGKHDTEHSRRVWRNTQLIADSEPGCDRLIVELKAFLTEPAEEAG